LETYIVDASYLRFVVFIVGHWRHR